MGSATPCVYCQTVVSGFRNARSPSRLAWGGILPVGADGAPAVAQALLVGVAVLRDDRSDPVRMLDREPEAGRRAVVEHIDGVAVEADGLGEAVDCLRDLVERVRLGRPIRIAEPREIRGDDMRAVGEARDEVAKHVARGREAVKQQEFRRVLRAGLAIEDVAAVDRGGPIVDGGHLVVPSLSNYPSRCAGVAGQDDAPGYADSVLLPLQATELMSALSSAARVRSCLRR